MFNGVHRFGIEDNTPCQDTASAGTKGAGISLPASSTRTMIEVTILKMLLRLSTDLRFACKLYHPAGKVIVREPQEGEFRR